MTKSRKFRLPALLALAALFASGVNAQESVDKKDVFKGKLFAPNIILENQDALDLTKDQFTAIKAAVVDVQANVAEHEWDMREAYMKMMAELDAVPVSEERVLEHVRAALKAENQVKQLQVAMLIKLRNLLTEQQVRYLQDLRNEQARP